MSSLATQIRLQKVAQRQRKSTYKYLSDKEKKIVKLIQSQNQNEKALNYFWSDVKRNEFGSVEWKSLNEKELDYFEFLQKKQAHLLKSLGKFTENEQYSAMKLFNVTNLHGTSF